jgi:hypothetical protein
MGIRTSKSLSAGMLMASLLQLQQESPAAALAWIIQNFSIAIFRFTGVDTGLGLESNFTWQCALQYDEAIFLLLHACAQSVCQSDSILL